MKKMRKMVSLALTAAMTAGLMTGMGALTASADSERTKITALLKGTESSEQFQTFDYLLKNFCDEKGLDYEIELVNDQQDYFTKLQMYINSDTLPDIFGEWSADSAFTSITHLDYHEWMNEENISTKN